MAVKNKGFTLLEVLIALAILTSSFLVLFQLVYQARANYFYSKQTFENLLYVDSKIKEGNYLDLNVSNSQIEILGIKINRSTFEKNGVYIDIFNVK
ncbi:prepilin-type N-terminal cleavage/methylation domain-containing protein [Sulfurihydrogenibium sp.]|jgi:prepilin-type N-terminal cleavage/methylation domain-containing protein|uniref:type IV pilus modification PilV family protein n=1 Tax=Sulfurihydrogenibium sp. TaxID=2053621 RepID=UPI0026214CF9|nr:prepilin-type N-terminal cleavage/methylation domain-containing protein [Sulfurihydrogenibium sp.]